MKRRQLLTQAGAGMAALAAGAAVAPRALAQPAIGGRARSMIFVPTTNPPRARDIILGILKKVVVKSKAMTSEEIHLNDAMENAGYEVVESDLTFHGIWPQR